MVRPATPRSEARRTAIRRLAPCRRLPRGEMLRTMFSTASPRLMTQALAPGRDAHERQRELVRASLLVRPAGPRPTHRRWA